jgi:hypothetical protein
MELSRGIYFLHGNQALRLQVRRLSSSETARVTPSTGRLTCGHCICRIVTLPARARM